MVKRTRTAKKETKITDAEKRGVETILRCHVSALCVDGGDPAVRHNALTSRPCKQEWKYKYKAYEREREIQRNRDEEI